MILFVRLRGVLRGAKEVAETEYEVELAVLVVNGLDLREEVPDGANGGANRQTAQLVCLRQALQVFKGSKTHTLAVDIPAIDGQLYILQVQLYIESTRVARCLLR